VISGETGDETTKANKRRNLMRFAFECHLIGLPVVFEKIFKQLKEIVIFVGKKLNFSLILITRIFFMPI
jgi:hypothetical protein